MMLSFKRRRPRFSVRGLLIAVTLVAAWLGWNVHVVRQRKASLAELQQSGAQFFFRTQYELMAQRNPASALSAGPLPQVSWVRRLLGDKAVVRLFVPTKLPDSTVDAAKSVFPEATTMKSDYAHFR